MNRVAGDVDISNRMVCFRCIGENFLSALIARKHGPEVCFYCGKKGAAISIEELAMDHVLSVFETYYSPTSSEPEGYNYFLAKEGMWQREGDTVVDLVQNFAEVDEEIAGDIQAVLDDRTSDYESVKIGEEQPFDSDAQYAERWIDHSHHTFKFMEFERILKEEARFFSPKARSTLVNIFAGLEEHQTSDGTSVVIDAGPDHSLKNFYRARAFEDHVELKKALAFPDMFMGPPERLRGSAGRMNAAGISVFYGSAEAGVALAEVRPPVGSTAVVARFQLTRNLRLLDLDLLRKVLDRGSVFDPTHAERVAHVHFLAELSRKFTRPVMPNHAAFEYLATQAISDYLANELIPPLDGILFESAQTDPHGTNVVLFHKASRVGPMALPLGSMVDVEIGQWNGDEFEMDYHVWEDVGGKSPHHAGDTLTRSESNEPRADQRPVTLIVDPESLVVHEVKGIAFTTEECPPRQNSCRPDKIINAGAKGLKTWLDTDRLSESGRWRDCCRLKVVM